LVTLDGSAVSEQALAPALAAAAAFHSEVTLLRVIHTLTAQELQQLDDKEKGLGQEFVDGQLSDANDYLCRVAEKNGPARGLFKVVIPADHAAEAITRYAESHGVDLIALATHGRTGFQRWTFGSVTDKVLHATETSMLVVRPQLDEQPPAQ